MSATPHDSCTHLGYSLTCAEYDELRALAAGQCMRCAVRTDALQIDHDHALGQWAVRGLVCHPCNHDVKFIDAGRRQAAPRDLEYFANAWHTKRPASATKAARVRPKVDCPACGKPTAVHANGRLGRHWSRIPGRHNEICSGAEPD